MLQGIDGSGRVPPFSGLTEWAFFGKRPARVLRHANKGFDRPLESPIVGHFLGEHVESHPTLGTGQNRSPVERGELANSIW